MLYREAGQFKSSYVSDMAIFPLRQDRIGLAVILLVAFVVIPLGMSSFTLNSLMIPILVFSLATIGLNILTGYTGLISLGTAAFLCVRAYPTSTPPTFFPLLTYII